MSILGLSCIPMDLRKRLFSFVLVSENLRKRAHVKA